MVSVEGDIPTRDALMLIQFVRRKEIFHYNKNACMKMVNTIVKYRRVPKHCQQIIQGEGDSSLNTQELRRPLVNSMWAC